MKSMKISMLALLFCAVSLRTPSVNAQDLPGIESDVTKQNQLETKVITLKYANGEMLVNALEDVKSKEGQVVFEKETSSILLSDRKATLDRMVSIVNEMDVPMITEVFTLYNRRAEELVPVLKNILTQRLGRVEIDPRSNKIIVTDTALKVKEVERRLLSLDHKQPEFKVSSKIIQIVLSDEHNNGVDWEAIVSDFSSIPFKAFQSGDGSYQTENLSFGSISSEDYEILLEALGTVGIIHDIAEDALPLGINGASTLAVNSIDLGLSDDTVDLEDLMSKEEVQLKIRPSMTLENTVDVEVQPIFIPAHKRVSRSPEDTMPADIRVTVNMENGSTLVVGNLFKNTMIELTRKIPLLGDLPFVGFAFRGEGKQLRKTEVIIFLTPVVEPLGQWGEPK